MCAGLSAAVLAGGCASKSSVATRPYSVAGPPVAVADYQGRRVEVEDDGIEAQPAPPVRRKPAADDPSEPFSPNYGRFSVLKPATETERAVHVPADLPEEFRIRLAQSLRER